LGHAFDIVETIDTDNDLNTIETLFQLRDPVYD
jgi:hypothetical protein